MPPGSGIAVGRDIVPCTGSHLFGVCVCVWATNLQLPYGTLSDDEMRTLNIQGLQDDGFCFLWVTGRAMELGRECLELWGYSAIEEVIWVKTNQLQRLIRTGRTGHWLNHSKEHCLVGVKGKPKANRGIDCDVIVAEVRETSRKPDELYGIIERLVPGGRKVGACARNMLHCCCIAGQLTVGVWHRDIWPATQFTRWLVDDWQPARWRAHQGCRLARTCHEGDPSERGSEPSKQRVVTVI